MRIVVVDIAASDGGALTILESFYQHVRHSAQGHQWIFLTGSDLFPNSEHIRVIPLPAIKNSWIRRLGFDLISGRRLIRSLNPDATLSLQNTFIYGIPSPQVVYVHQSLPFQQEIRFSPWRKDQRVLAIYQYLIGAMVKQSIKRAEHVIVQTKWMRDAVLEQVAIPDDSISQITPDLDDLGTYSLSAQLDSSSFFYPTADALYKNNECIYAACRQLRQAGVTDFRVTLTVDGPSHDPNVNTAGRISREQVLSALSRSTLIFPSYIETYGLPLSEAMALNVIVLSADLPYARETLDGYVNAHYFDPASPEELSSLMRDVIRGTIVRSELPRNDGPTRQGPGPSAWARVVNIVESCVNEGGPET